MNTVTHPRTLLHYFFFEALASSQLEELFTAALETAQQLSGAATIHLYLKKARTFTLEPSKKNTNTQVPKTVKLSPSFQKRTLEKNPFLFELNRTFRSAQPALYKNNEVLYLPLKDKTSLKGFLLLTLSQPLPKEEEATWNALDSLGLFVSLGMEKINCENASESSLQLQDAFFGLLLHDFRTPLTSILGYAQLVEQKIKNGQELQAEWLTQLITQTHRLELMTRKLLELNKIRSAELRYKWHYQPLSQVVSQVMTELQAAHPDWDVQFDVLEKTSSFKVIIDTHLFVQSILNFFEDVHFSYQKKLNLSLKISTRLKKVSWEWEIFPVSFTDQEYRELKTFSEQEQSHPHPSSIHFTIAKIILDQHKTEMKVSRPNQKKIKLTLSMKSLYSS